MRIGIVGLGSIGTLLCNHLLQSNRLQLLALVKNKERYNHLVRNGLCVTSSSPSIRNLINPNNNEWKDILCMGTFPVPMDIIILTVKSYDLYDAIQGLVQNKDSESHYKETIWIPLQNGIGQEEIIRQILPTAEICPGITYMGGYQQSPSNVIYAGKGRTYIEDLPNDKSTKRHKLQLLVQILRETGVECDIVNQKEMKNRIWKKLLINAVINPIASVLNQKNGCLVKGGEKMKSYIENLCNEILLLAQKENVELHFDTNAAQDIMNVAKKTENNVCSMLSDIRQGRRTENEYISGGICRLAKQNGLSLPMNEAMYKIIQVLEENAREANICSSNHE